MAARKTASKTEASPTHLQLADEAESEARRLHAAAVAASPASLARTVFLAEAQLVATFALIELTKAAVPAAEPVAAPVPPTIVSEDAS